jgi:hypothetical protein
VKIANFDTFINYFKKLRQYYLIGSFCNTSSVVNSVKGLKKSSMTNHKMDSKNQDL